MESFGAISGTLPLTPLSVQQVCGCTYRDRSGCEGGTMSEAYMRGIRDWGGQVTAAELPYTEMCGQCAVVESCDKPISNQGYHQARSGTLQDVLDTAGPPAVAVTARSWQTYRQGILFSCDSSQGVDHA
eukprot:g15015.t1